MHDYEKIIQERLAQCREQLLKSGQQLATAESCTGGWISKCITDLPGSSAWYWGGVCSYANQAKQILLQVPEYHLQQYGAVSPAVAEDMALGILHISGCGYSLAVTGIAGPDGGSEEKPVGLVYIVAADKTGCVVREYHFAGDRKAVRLRTVAAALALLLEKF